MSSISFVAGKPAMVIGRALIVADLHLGIEREFYKSGIKFPSQTHRIVEQIDMLIKEARSRKLIILGDVKHKVPGISMQELREIPDFLGYFSKKIKVEIVPGNHDGGIENLLPENVKIHESSGFVLGDVYLSHGHSWPGPEFLGCSAIVMGHQHPMVEFRDRLNYRFIEQVWVRGKLMREKIMEKFKKIPKSIPEAVVMPAFNELAGGIAVNSEMAGEKAQNYIGPVIKALDRKSLRIFMLDGTYLGKLPDISGAKFN